ncbi:hypothetical protein HK104_002855, partial [Borealophlyctis nickersoniae]
MTSLVSPASLLDGSQPLRAIIHVDIDYFYAQAEEVADPSLKEKPVAIQQKHIVVTCNYVARSYGIGKLELLTTARQKCPHLHIIDGSDITRYRRASRRIFELVKHLVNGATAASDDTGANWKVKVERLGMDELFLDVTDLIGDHLEDIRGPGGGDGGTPRKSRPRAGGSNGGSSRRITCDDPKGRATMWPDGEVVFRLPGGAEADSLAGYWSSGFSYPPNTWSAHLLSDDPSSVPAKSTPIHIQYLQIASHLATHIRSAIRSVLGFTSSAGVAHNKLYAKLVGGLHKPNDQTSLLPGDAARAFLDGMNLRKVPGFGYTTINMVREKLTNLDLEDSGTSAAAEDNDDVGCVDAGVDDPDWDAPERPDEAEKTQTSPSLTVQYLRTHPGLANLLNQLPTPQAQTLSALLNGIDPSPVIPTGPPSQITTEDSFRHCTTLLDALTRLRKLTETLIDRVQEEEYDTSPPKPRWRRHASTLRITIRRRRVSSNPTGWGDDRETKSVPCPVSIYDVATDVQARAQDLVKTTLYPLLKRMVTAPCTPPAKQGAAGDG